jgi:hypothetical protein
MTDKEITLALFGLLGDDTKTVLEALVLLRREIPLETITECRKEMMQMINNLSALLEPKMKVAIKDLLDKLGL